MFAESLNFNNKPLKELTLDESMEYEKSVLRKVLAASGAGMSQGIIDQMNLVLEIIREHKAEMINKEIAEIKGGGSNKYSGGLMIGEDQPEPPDSDE